jgi:hypothetical protein
VDALSDLAKAEHVPHPVHASNTLTKWMLGMPILKSHTSSRPPLILPTVSGKVVHANAVSAISNDQASPENKKYHASNSALTLSGVEHSAGYK